MRRHQDGRDEKRPRQWTGPFLISRSRAAGSSGQAAGGRGFFKAPALVEAAELIIVEGGDDGDEAEDDCDGQHGNSSYFTERIEANLRLFKTVFGGLSCTHDDVAHPY